MLPLPTHHLLSRHHLHNNQDMANHNQGMANHHHNQGMDTLLLLKITT